MTEIQHSEPGWTGHFTGISWLLTSEIDRQIRKDATAARTPAVRCDRDVCSPSGNDNDNDNEEDNDDEFPALHLQLHGKYRV